MNEEVTIITSDAPIVDDTAMSNYESSPISDSASPKEKSVISPSSETQGTFTANLMKSSVSLTFIDDALAVPSDWVDEAKSHPALSIATTFIDRMSPVGKVTPWVITSMTKDLSGATRSDSGSHANGFGMDLSPMYSTDTLLPDSMPVMGLAWNIKSLILLSQTQFGDLPMFIEGDHVHFDPRMQALHVGEIPILWSESSAYPAARYQAENPILSRLSGSYWIWNMTSMSLTPPSKRTAELVKHVLENCES